MDRYQKKKSRWVTGGRLIWLAMMCASLVLTSQIAALNEEHIWRRVLHRAIDPICGMSGYLQTTTDRDGWREVLTCVFSLPLALSGYCGQVEGQIAVSGDPVYDRYQSSELLYHGGQITLPSENESTGENQPGGDLPVMDTIESEASNSDEGTPDSSNSNGLDKDPSTGSNENSVGEVIQTHLPTVATGKRYTKLQLQNFNYLVDQLYFVHSSTCVYPSQLDVDTLLSKNLTIDRQTTGPQILIHHTHGTEDFADSEEGNGKTILELGDYLTELLTGYGYTVIHDRSIYPYDTAYSEASAQVKKILAANPSIQLVIDLHRDATASQKRHIVELNGQTMAPLMFFNGMCQTADGPIDYLNNPYLEDNLALSLQMKLIAEAYYPGLTRPNFLKAYQYNQHLLPRYTLIEAGFDTNTFEEVCRSMVPLANILDAVLSDPGAANGCVWE